MDTLKSGYWYKVVYNDETTCVFRFTSTDKEGNVHADLCNDEKILNPLSKEHKEIIELGEDSPCDNL